MELAIRTDILASLAREIRGLVPEIDVPEADESAAKRAIDIPAVEER